MDADRFDALSRVFGGGSRRTMLAAVGAALVALVAPDDDPAIAKSKRGTHRGRHDGTAAVRARDNDKNGNDNGKKKKACPPCKKRKKGKCKANQPDGTPCENGGACLSGSCRPASGATDVLPPPPPPPPPPPGCTPNCFDRVCGPDGCDGSCGSCPLTGQLCDRGACVCPANQQEVCGRACLAPCLPGTVRHPQTCRCCIPSGQPSGGSSDNCCSGSVSGATCVGFSQSACTFDEQCSSGNCLGGRCEVCPKAEVAFAGLDYCAQPGGFRECSSSAGFYVCLTAIDGNTRCGRRNSNVDCNGCSSDIDCLVELGQGSGAFCVRDTGPGCDCPDGQTFCAVPRP